MCEFCVKHGDGQRWYLNAANYSEDLLHDLKREKYIEDFLPDVRRTAVRWLRVLDRAMRTSPGATRRLMRIQSRRLKRVHFGQVVPIEDVESILGIVGQVIRLPCVCRETMQKKEEALCYLVALSPDKMGFVDIVGRREGSLPIMQGMEKVEPAKALEEMSSLEDRGLVHTVWTFIAPFTGAICNCDPAGCLAMNFTRRGLPMYFPGEEAAAVDSESCDACGACLEICLFGALSADETGRARVDGELCHGCGICRKVCPSGALELTPRPQPCHF